MSRFMDCLTALGGRMDEMSAKMEAMGKPAADDMEMDAAEPVTMPHKFDGGMGDAQSRADAAATAWGLRAPIPRENESVLQYRKRALRPHLAHSSQFAKADLSVLGKDPESFAAIESSVYSDSIAASRNPNCPDDGQMIWRDRQMDSGHMCREYYGKRTIFESMASPPMFVRRFLTNQADRRDD